MPVKKIYTKADVKAAIDTANEHYFGQLLRVRNDLTNEQFSSTEPTGTYPGRGSDVGHSFRHVDGTAPGGKSTFQDNDSLYLAVMSLLNSPSGQKELGDLDTATPEGGEQGYNGRSVITATISQSVARLNLYGTAQDGTKKKVKRAMCIVQKLGGSTLWVHTAYPTSFIA